MEKKTSTLSKNSTTVHTNNLDYSKGEELTKNITIPNSQFQAKWIKDEGYAVGYEGFKLTRNYKTLDEALNQIGYGVDKDEEGEEILVKHGEVDFELIARLVKAIVILNDENNLISNINEKGAKQNG